MTAITRWAKAFRAPSIAALALAILALASAGCQPPNDPPEPQIDDTEEAALPAGNLHLGDPLPDFELPTLGGGTVRLADQFDGEHYVAVVFHSPTCPCSRNCAEAIGTKLPTNEYPDLKLVAVVSDRYYDHDWFKEDLQKQIDEGLLNFPVAIDADQAVLSTYGAQRTPTVWLADKQGKIRFYGAPENVLEPDSSKYQFLMKNALDDMRAGRAVEVPTFQPIGCPIAVREKV